MGTAIRRRAALLVLVLGAWPAAAAAQPATPTARIGFLWGGSLPGPLLREFEVALREHGWEVGRNLVIVHRAAEGRNERLPELAGELVRDNVQVLLTAQSTSTIAARRASRTIPIVMLGNGDPVRYGLVTNLARPEANVTGVSFLANEMAIKTIELLKEAAPRVERVALATANRWPAVSPSATFLDAGALLSYTPPLSAIYRQAAVYTDKLLRGARPADLPVEDPRKFELVLNQKAAMAVGLTFSPSLLLRADRVIP